MWEKDTRANDVTVPFRGQQALCLRLDALLQ